MKVLLQYVKNTSKVEPCCEKFADANETFDKYLAIQLKGLKP
jgi:hypothetical protein